MSKLTDNSPMPCGKYKGEKMANVPASYLLWLYENNKCSHQVREYIKDNHEALIKEVQEAHAKQYK